MLVGYFIRAIYKITIDKASVLLEKYKKYQNLNMYFSDKYKNLINKNMEDWDFAIHAVKFVLKNNDFSKTISGNIYTYFKLEK